MVRCGSHMPFPCVTVSPYDAELYGHWWFEGPQWLYHVLREGAQGGDLALSTPSAYLDAHPIQQKAVPAPSSWGEKGFHEHWVNPQCDWIWRPLHEAGTRMCRTVRESAEQPRGHTVLGVGLTDRVLRQAGRELMLAQSSDWPFMISNGDTKQYANRRVNEHLNRFHDLLNGLQHGHIDSQRLSALEYMDAIFPQLDYRLFAPSSA